MKGKAEVVITKLTDGCNVFDIIYTAFDGKRIKLFTVGERPANAIVKLLNEEVIESYVCED